MAVKIQEFVSKSGLRQRWYSDLGVAKMVLGQVPYPDRGEWTLAEPAETSPAHHPEGGIWRVDDYPGGKE